MTKVSLNIACFSHTCQELIPFWILKICYLMTEWWMETLLRTWSDENTINSLNWIFIHHLIGQWWICTGPENAGKRIRVFRGLRGSPMRNFWYSRCLNGISWILKHNNKNKKHQMYLFWQIWYCITKVTTTSLIFVVGEKLKNLYNGIFASFMMLYLSVLTDG